MRNVTPWQLLLLVEVAVIVIIRPFGFDPGLSSLICIGLTMMVLPLFWFRQSLKWYKKLEDPYYRRFWQRINTMLIISLTALWGGGLLLSLFHASHSMVVKSIPWGAGLISIVLMTATTLAASGQLPMSFWQATPSILLTAAAIVAAIFISNVRPSWWAAIILVSTGIIVHYWNRRYGKYQLVPVENAAPPGTIPKKAS